MKKILIALAFALGSLSAQSETAASASVTVGDITLPQRLAALPDDIFFADKAVARARALAQPGDSVLLAPATASFDQYSGYDARGDAFAYEVTSPCR